MKQWARANWEVIQRWRGRRFPKGFEGWCRRIPQAGQQFSLSEFLRNNPTIQEQDIAKQFAEEVIRPNSPCNTILVDGTGQYAVRFAFPFRDEPPTDLDESQLRTIGIFTVQDNARECAITGGVIGILTLWPKRGEIRLSNCLVAHLEVPNDRKVRLEMTNCWVGRMSIEQASLEKLTVIGGGIADVECPPPDRANPCVGSVTFSEVFFPVSSIETTLFLGPQGYRNLRAHMEKLDNAPAANQLRAVQFRSERQHEKGIASLVNRFYDFFSRYGSNVTRPLAWLFAAYVAAAAIIYQWDGGMLSQPVQAYVGAYASFLEWHNGRLWRSLLLPFQSIFNPFGFFFDARKLVIPANSWASVLLFMQGLFSDVMLLLFGICLRRRFKLS